MMTFTGIGLVTLPNPELQNVEGLNVSINSRQAMDSTRYTTVKSNPDRNFSYTLRIDVQKLFQLQQFVRDNAGRRFNLTDHEDVTRQVYFDVIPIAFADDSFTSVGSGSRNEFGSVTIQVTGA